MRSKSIAMTFVGIVIVLLLPGVVSTRPTVGSAVDMQPASVVTPAASRSGRLGDIVMPHTGSDVFLPAIMKPAPSTPTPTQTSSPTATPTRTPTSTPTATATPAATPTSIPSMVLNPTCSWFPLGPSGSDDVECTSTQGLKISRYNISFTMVACCGTANARHYAVSVEAAKISGDGDYRIGFDVRSLNQGGGYLFGVNPDTRAYSLYRVDDGDWKGGVPLVPWTVSEAILPGSQVNHLQVERRGADIVLTINGQQVAMVQDTTWLDQGIGWTLYARNYLGVAEMRYERMRYSQWNDGAGE